MAESGINTDMHGRKCKSELLSFGDFSEFRVAKVFVRVGKVNVDYKLKHTSTSYFKLRYMSKCK